MRSEKRSLAELDHLFGSPQLIRDRIERVIPKRLLAPPIDLAAVFRAIGVRIEYVDRDTCNGRIEYRGGAAFIQVRRQVDANRQRMVEAHELAHHIIQTHLVGRRENLFGRMAFSHREYQREESLADEVAAELLMPRGIVSSLLVKGIDNDTVDRAISAFEVPRPVALRRLGELHSAPMLSLDLMPAWFDQASSEVEIDDAWLFSAKKKPRRLTRACIALAAEMSFEEFGGDGGRVLRWVTIDGKPSLWSFDVRYRWGRVLSAHALSDQCVGRADSSDSMVVERAGY